MNKSMYVLQKLPAITEEKAIAMIAVGLTDIKLVRAATDAQIKAAATLSDPQVAAIKAFRK